MLSHSDTSRLWYAAWAHALSTVATLCAGAGSVLKQGWEPFQQAVGFMQDGYGLGGTFDTNIQPSSRSIAPKPMHPAEKVMLRVIEIPCIG